ncbi:hypothetical protein ACFQ3W_22600 [Paenibacillus puldeungensis]|uniref:RsgI N-terminal anti-sigma domain-containing protein n=1 Tax=Paenibacillus puldeungensis TaxID=696536 RepID=A0ABW3S3K0_9BACL
MKITENCIVVLCQDGTFRNLPLPAELPKLGESINVDSVRRPQKLDRRRFKSSMWLAAASILLIIGAVVLLNSFTGTKQPLTLVAVDINPSVELWVDQKEKIKEVELINDDAKSLVSDQDLQGKTIYDALGLIIDKAEQGGYLDPRSNKKWVWITIVPPKGAGNPVLTIDRNKLPAFNKDYSLEVFTANRAMVEQAKKANLTINKYVVYRQALDQGIDIDTAKLRTHSIVSVLASAGIEPETLFKNAANPSVEQQSGEMSGSASQQGTEPATTSEQTGGNSEGIAEKQTGKGDVQLPAANQGSSVSQIEPNQGKAKAAPKGEDGVSGSKTNSTATFKKNSNNNSNNKSNNKSSVPSAEAGSNAAANGSGAEAAEKKPLSQQAAPKANDQPVKKNDKKSPENGQTKNDHTSMSQEPAKGNGSASNQTQDKGQGIDPANTSESINHETAKPHNDNQNKPETETGKETEPAESKSNESAGGSGNSSQNQTPAEHHTPSDNSGGSGGGGHKTK